MSARRVGSVVRAAIAQARQRVGPAPLRGLFVRTAEAWATPQLDRARWRGLRVYAVDGSAINVADTPENHEHFGRPGSSRGGPSGYPKARLVALSAPRSHLLVDMAVGPYGVGELELAKELWSKIADESV